MRRIAILLTAMLLALATFGGSALAMEPAGEPAKKHFGCLDGEDNAVGGHPGAAGLTHATPMVGALTENQTPTAWNAVEKAGPIELGSC